MLVRAELGVQGADLAGSGPVSSSTGQGFSPTRHLFMVRCRKAGAALRSCCKKPSSCQPATASPVAFTFKLRFRHANAPPVWQTHNTSLARLWQHLFRKRTPQQMFAARPTSRDSHHGPSLLAAIFPECTPQHDASKYYKGSHYTCLTRDNSASQRCTQLLDAAWPEQLASCQAQQT
jgi:hypothetical protein